jgi:LPPG:FO 2-phospho-L-lactate transferase
MREGQSLSQVTNEFCERLGVEIKLLPMSDQPIRTVVDTNAGELAFQEYFVARACEPAVRGFRFAGAEQAQPATGVMEAIGAADLIVLCPSNPWVSIDPILAVPGIRQAVAAKAAIGVSPIVAGTAIKGPAAKMFAELQIEPSALAVAQHYRGVLGALVIDTQDASLMEPIMELEIRAFVTNTIMANPMERQRLATEVLAFAAEAEFVI